MSEIDDLGKRLVKDSQDRRDKMRRRQERYEKKTAIASLVLPIGAKIIEDRLTQKAQDFFNQEEVLNLKKSPPEKIKNERVNIKPDYIHITWFKPKTSKEHPVLRYICIIENDMDKSIKFEIPNISNNDLMEHYFRGLQKNVFYNIKIYSENNNGISNPVIINRISLSDKKTEPVKIKNEVQQTKYKTNFDETTLKNKLLESSYMKSFIIKILSPLF